MVLAAAEDQPVALLPPPRVDKADEIALFRDDWPVIDVGTINVGTWEAPTIPTEVTINCFLGEGKPTVVRGKVVRQEPLGPEETSLWRSKVAVEMAEPNADLAKHFEKVSARQAVTYGKD